MEIFGRTCDRVTFGRKLYSVMSSFIQRYVQCFTAIALDVFTAIQLYVLNKNPCRNCVKITHSWFT